MTCQSIFEDWVCSCLYGPSELTILTTLDAGEYVAAFFLWKDRTYTAPAIADAQGNLVIQLEDLPGGLFDIPGGVIDMALYTDETLCDKIDIPIRATFSKIEISIRGGNSGKMSIGCQ